MLQGAAKSQGRLGKESYDVMALKHDLQQLFLQQLGFWPLHSEC